MSWQSKHKNTPGIEIFFPRGVYVCQVSTHEPRADALYCLLTQTVCSLRAQEKQMSALQTLVFLLGPLHVPHYSVLYYGCTFTHTQMDKQHRV